MSALSSGGKAVERKPVYVIERIYSVCITSSPSPHLIGEKHPNHMIFHFMYIYIIYYVNLYVQH